MTDKCTHEEYYGQLVTQGIKDHLTRAIPQSIAKSKDPSFNDIPLDTWDRIGAYSVPNTEFKKLGDFRTAMGVVCVLKEAARQIREEK
jgi:hypothetical protein